MSRHLLFCLIAGFLISSSFAQGQEQGEQEEGSGDDRPTEVPVPPEATDGQVPETRAPETRATRAPPTKGPSQDDADDGDDQTVLIAIVVVAAIALIAIIILLVALLRQYNRTHGRYDAKVGAQRLSPEYYV